MVNKILFLCSHNSFRSKIAEAVFNKLYKGKKYKASSAGIFPGPLIYPNTKKSVKEVGYNIGEKPRGLSFNELQKQDKVIIISKDIPKQLFSHYSFMKNKVEVWKISDTDAKETKKIKKITKEIEKKVKRLIKQIQ